MKIRGTTVGTTIKPEKILLKATDLTEEEKAQARANLGIGGGTDFSWKVVAETTLAENPEGVNSLAWNFDGGDITTEDLKKMSEFKLLIKMPFTEDISASDFNILVMLINADDNKNYMLFQDNTIACTGGTPDAPKTLSVMATITKLDTVYLSTYRQALSYNDKVTPKTVHRECNSSNGNLFDAKQWSFKVQLKTRALPVGTQVLLEGR